MVSEFPVMTLAKLLRTERQPTAGRDRSSHIRPECLSSKNNKQACTRKETSYVQTTKKKVCASAKETNIEHSMFACLE